MSYRLADKAFDSIFGPESEGLQLAIDPMLRVKYYDEMRRRIDDHLKSPQTSKDFKNFPNALAFVNSLPLIERKDAGSKKAEGRVQVGLDSLYIGDDFDANEPLSRVKQFVEHAVDMMTLPPDSKRWGMPAKTQSEPTPSFTTPAGGPKIAVLRAGYSSIIIHLLAFEYWLSESRRLTPVQSREEYRASNPVPNLPFKLPDSYYLKREEGREEAYDNLVIFDTMLREYQLGADKMRRSIIPAFEGAFPNQMVEVEKVAETYIGATKRTMKKSGEGAFYFGLVVMKMTEESSLVLSSTERLQKVFSKDISVKALTSNLISEYWFMRERLAKVVDKKRRGLGF